jgi:hypothetical protein
MSSERYYVYFLCDPTRPFLKYINGFTLNYEPYYCGKGTGNRYKHKKNYAVECKTKSLRKKGLEPHYVQIGLFEEKTAFSLEEYFVDLFKRRDQCNDGLLLNLQDGGKGGRSPSKESKLKMSQSHKNKKPWNYNKKGLQTAWNKGISQSAEVKQKISDSKIGFIPWNKGKKYYIGDKHHCSKKVIVDNIEYSTIKEAEKATGLSRYKLKSQGYVL